MSILDPGWGIKIFIFLLCLVLAYFAFYFRNKSRELIAASPLMKSSAAKEPAKPGAISARWEEIKRHVVSAREYEWKFAVVEADKLVENILAGAGFQGESMGERLMSIDKSKLTSIEGLWEAHKMRNKIVHDPNYFLRDTEARRIIGLYENALRELNAID